MFIEEKASGEGQGSAPSMRGMADFVAGKPADEHYPYTNSHGCACAQYLKSIEKFDDRWLSEPKYPVMTDLNRIASGQETIGGVNMHADQWTFGKLAVRLQKELEKELV